MFFIYPVVRIVVIIMIWFERRGIKSFKAYDTFETIFQAQLAEDLSYMRFVGISEDLEKTTSCS